MAIIKNRRENVLINEQPPEIQTKEGIDALAASVAAGLIDTHDTEAIFDLGHPSLAEYTRLSERLSTNKPIVGVTKTSSGKIKVYAGSFTRGTDTATQGIHFSAYVVNAAGTMFLYDDWYKPDGTLTENAYVVAPLPPTEGTHVLKCTNGTLSWVAETEDE